MHSIRPIRSLKFLHRDDYNFKQSDSNHKLILQSKSLKICTCERVQFWSIFWSEFCEFAKNRTHSQIFFKFTDLFLPMGLICPAPNNFFQQLNLCNYTKLSSYFSLKFLSYVIFLWFGEPNDLLLYNFSRWRTGISYDNVTREIKPFSAEVQNDVNLAPKRNQKDSQLSSL